MVKRMQKSFQNTCNGYCRTQVGDNFAKKWSK